MKQTKKANWKKILLCSTLLANMAVTQLAPVTQVFADELKTSDSTTTTSSEATEATELEEPISTNESTTSDSAVATPTLTQTKEVTTLSTGEELANRANPTDVQGLTDDQIQALANALYGDMAKRDPNFGMSVLNDKGEVVPINFTSRLLRSNGTAGEMINVTWNVTRGSWTAWGEYLQKLHIDGKLSYCVQPGVFFIPGEGFTAQTSLGSITAEQMKNLNKYINFGAKDSDSNEFYVATQMAIWEVLGWSVTTNLGNYEGYKAQISQNINDFKKTPSFDTKEVTIIAGQNLTLEDTNGVLSNFNVQSDNTNSKIVKNGNKLTITPSLDSQDGSIDLVRNSYYSGNQYFYVNGNGSQTVSTGGMTDPTVGYIKVKVIKEGDLQIGKQDGVTGKMVAGTTYKGTIGDDQVEFTTGGTEGLSALSKKYIHGTPYNLVETAVPDGYVLDQTPMTGTIVGGETTKLTQKNDIQKAQVTVEKTKEVYNAEESTKQGKPVYETKPAPEIPFTQKSTKDVTAPDGKTVIEKAGEYTDTQVTTDKGVSTFKPFYNGAQNEYLLTEDQTPENYRPMEPKKIVIPYGESSVSVVAHTEKIQNLLKKGKLVLNKKNSIDLANPLNLAGAKFHIKGEANTNTADVDLTTTTTEKSTEMEVKDGWYFISEIQYPTGFTQPEGKTETMRVLVKDGETTVVDWENAPINKPVTPTTPKTTTVAPVSTKTTGTLPHTGEKSNSWIVALGAITIVSAASAYVFYKKPKKTA